MNNKIIEFRDFYKVQKTITFELKSVDKYDLSDINFTKTSEYIEKEYFSKIDNTDGIAEIKRSIEYGTNLLFFSQNISLSIKNRSISLRALEIDKNLIQKCDRELYHTLKKKKVIIVKRINHNTNKEYNHELRFSNPMILLDVFEMNEKGQSSFLTEYLDKLNLRLALFQSKIKTDLETIYSKQTETEKILHFESGKVNFYANTRLCLGIVKDLMEILNLTKQSNFDCVNESNWNKTKKVLKDLETLKDEYKNLEETLKIIEDVINEEAKKPVILTSLNLRAINKNQDKIDKEWEKVQDLEKEIKNLEIELSGINDNKRDVVEKLEWALKKNIDFLKVLDSQTSIGRQALDLCQKANQNIKLNDDEYLVLKQFKFAKKVNKYIKLNGVLVSEKKHIFNYGKLNEKINYNFYKPQDNPLKIETHSKFNQFKKEYFDYKNLCDDKFKKSQQLGNAKSLYNAIRREVERQKEMKYLSLLCKDNNFYYLVLIDKDYNETNKIISNLLSNSISDWQMLEYHKITFKAIEKLALLDKSTFDVGDLQLTDEIKEIMKSYKEKKFKEYKLNREEKIGIFDENQQERKRTELQKYELIKIIDYIKKVINKLGDCRNYNFNFKESDQHQRLEEFVDEIDKQGYCSKWKNIDKSILFREETEENENVLIFKLHNKDFRKGKNAKENLFTKYWRDAMMLGNDIRLTPEIDVLKRNNEITKDKKIIVKKTGEQKTVKDKFRFNQNKLYGAFNLEFYPTRKSDFETVNKKVVFSDKVYYLGLDRGEKSLVSWCLIDLFGNVVKNGDWTKFKPKNDYENTNEEHNYADDLKNYQEVRLKLSEEYQKVSDYNEESEKEEKLEGLLATEKIKKGYCGYLIDGVNQILKEYPNTYIVLEDLDIKYNKDGTPKTGDENIDNKIKNLEKTFGGTVYQAIENAIINKFKYFTVKDKKEYNGLQLVPNIVKVEDLRIIEKDDDKNKFGKTKWIKSKDKIGNILFVDEEFTSKTCPVCGFRSEKRLKNLDNCKNDKCPELERKQLSKVLCNSDDIAAYNIAKKGMQLKK